MNLEILTPDKKLFSGDAEYVYVPGQGGGIGILNKHAPLIAALKAGEVKVRDIHKKEQTFTIKGGLVEVKYNNVVVLAE
jgi:F-type H+-transporting ATPase subunit epsilon